MKNRDIEERAKKAYPLDGTNMMVGLIQRNSYMLGALEQKAIDDKKTLQQELTYIDKTCNIFCHIGCPHKTDSYDCLKDKCDALKAFKRMMAE